MTVENKSTFACTMHWPAGPAGASRGQLWLRNDVGELQIPTISGEAPAEIQIDFTKAGVHVDLDPSTIACRGFTVTSVAGGVMVLTQTYARLTWGKDAPWIVCFAKLPRPAGSTGTVSVTLTNVFSIAESQTATTPFAAGSVDPDTWSRQHPVNAKDTTTGVSITSFTVNPTALQDITEPTSVRLSWDTTAANNKVTLTGFGAVSNSGVLSISILETTSFVLTVYDADLIPVASQTVEVTVTPSIRSRLVPNSSVVAYRGSTAPIGWAMCDGKTSGVPDMSDKFIVGAGPDLDVDTTDSSPSHTHPLAQSTTIAPVEPWTTSTDGVHTHTMPDTWSAASWKNPGMFDNTAWSIDCYDSGYDASATPTQSSGGHSHTAPISWSQHIVKTGVSDGGQRPPWYALAYMMKLPQILAGTASTTSPTQDQLIVDFAATVTSPTDNNDSVQVSLNWQTTDATSVLISPLGRMNDTNGTTQCSISQTTTFTLIAFQGANIASRSIVVTVTPDLRSQLVPADAIVPMNSIVAPSGWLLCDGTNDTPNLGGRFVVCIGTESLGTCGDADVHTHDVGQIVQTNVKTNSASEHVHGMPVHWGGAQLHVDSTNSVGINTGSAYSSTDLTATGGGGDQSQHSFSYCVATTTTSPQTTMCPAWYTLYYYMKG